MTDNELMFHTLNTLRLNKPLFLAKAVTIRTKTGEHKPFILNRGQLFLHNTLEEIKKRREYLRIVIVKGRQMGCSTYIVGRFFHDAIFELGLAVFILTHHSESTQHIFGMVRDFYDFLPEPLKLQVPLKASNRKELVFAVQRSSYHIGTAGTGSIGRGTTIQRFHGSEVASFTNTDEISNGVMNAVGEVPGTELILESTANGIGNYFHNMAMSGLRENSKFVTIFLPWYWMPEYSDTPPPGTTFTGEEQDLQHLYGLSNEQLFWRRRKIEDDCEGKVWRFQQEYPMNLHEAFVTSGVRLLDAQRVQSARKNSFKDPMAPIVMGLDPAHERDRTVFLIRQGRSVLHHRIYRGGTIDDPSTAGIAAELIEKYDIDHVFIDIGAGYGVFDILKNLGYASKITKIHFGQKAMLPDVYQNKSAEMAHNVQKWFSEQEVDIPDDDEFVTDLLAIPELKQTTGRGVLALPDKEEIAKLLGGMSCDIFDALRLTFAFPVMSNKARRITEDLHARIQKKILKNVSFHRKTLFRIGR